MKGVTYMVMEGDLTLGDDLQGGTPQTELSSGGQASRRTGFPHQVSVLGTRPSVHQLALL